MRPLVCVILFFVGKAVRDCCRVYVHWIFPSTCLCFRSDERCCWPSSYPQTQHQAGRGSVQSRWRWRLLCAYKPPRAQRLSIDDWVHHTHGIRAINSTGQRNKNGRDCIRWCLGDSQTARTSASNFTDWYRRYSSRSSCTSDLCPWGPYRSSWQPSCFARGSSPPGDPFARVFQSLLCSESRHPRR